MDVLSFPRVLLLAIFLAVSVSPQVFSAQVGRFAIPVGGERFEAELTTVDREGRFVFQTVSGPRSLPATELVRWGTAPEFDDAPLVMLADGSVLIADVREINAEELVADSVLFGEVRLPLARMRGVVFHPPAERLERDRLLDRVMQSAGSRDRLLLENGDVIEGVLAGGGQPAVQGPPPPQDTPLLESLRMQVDDGAADVPLERVVAVVFNPSLVETPAASGLRVWCGFEDNGLIQVETFAPSQDLVTLQLPGGVRLQTDEEGFRESLQLLQPVGGKAVYLSDLAPIGYRHIPFLAMPWEYARDRNPLGGRLRSEGRNFLKGLGMHSTSRLAYRLDGGFQEFKAELALDDAVGREGSVVYRVYTAIASGEWKPALETQVIRGGEPPIAVSVNVAGARGLALIVEYADRGDVQDHAIWIDARLE